MVTDMKWPQLRWGHTVTNTNNEQRFIQAILMSGRRHKKFSVLIEFSNSLFINIIVKHIKTCWRETCIQYKLVCWVSSTFNYSFALYMLNIFLGLCPLNPHQSFTIKLMWSLHHICPHHILHPPCAPPSAFYNNFVMIFHELEHSKTQSLLKNRH